jgi:MFS family permease
MCQRSSNSGSPRHTAWQPSPNYRWRRIAPASVLAMCGYGAFVYGSSAFILPVQQQAPSLPISVVPYAFSLRSVIFALGNLVLGPLLLRGSPATWVALAVVLMLLGCAGAAGSVATASASALYLSLSLSGAACCAMYVPVYQPMISWFSDRKGTIAGLAGVGQAVGGMAWNGLSPVLAERVAASWLFVVYGLAVCAMWSFAAAVVWPPAGPPAPPPSCVAMLVARIRGGRHGTHRSSSAADGSSCCTLVARSAAMARAPLLWTWLCANMLSGFGIFAVLLYWLEEAADLPPAAAGGAASGFGAAFLLGRVGAGGLYDRVGARRFAIFFGIANLVLHAALALEQALLPVPRTAALERWVTAPLLVLLLLTNAGAVTAWGPLTLDLLGPSGKLTMPYWSHRSRPRRPSARH